MELQYTPPTDNTQPLQTGPKPETVAENGLVYTPPSKSNFYPEQQATPFPNKDMLETKEAVGSVSPKESAILTNYNRVSDTSAKDNADSLEIGKKTGISPDIVRQNLESARKAMSQPDQEFLNKMQTNSPGLSKFLEDPTNMAAVHNDLPDLSKRESLIDNLQKGTYTLASNAVGVGSLAGKFVKDATGYSLPGYDKEQEWVRSLDKSASDIVTSIGDRDLTGDKSLSLSDPEYYEGAAHKLAQWLPNIAAFVATAELGLAAGVGKVVMMLSTGGAMSAMTEAESLKHGEGYGASTLKAGITGATMAIPLPFVGSAVGVLYRPLVVKFGPSLAKDMLTNTVRTYLETSGAFAVQGQAQLLANSIVDKATGADPNAFQNYYQKAKENIAESSLSSIGWSAPHIAKGASSLLKGQDAYRKAQADFDASKASNKALVDLLNHETISDKDAKSHSQEAIKAMKEAHPGVGSVIIPTDTFEEFCQDKKPEDVLKEFGDKSVESYTNPASSHVEIPLEELLTSGKAKTLLPLIDEMKVNHDVPSVREAKDELDKTKSIQTEQDKVAERRKALEDKIIESVMKTGEAKSKGVAVAKWASNLLDKGAETFGMEFHNNKKSFDKPFINSTPEQNNEVFNQTGMSWDKLNAQKVDSKGKTQADYLKSREEKMGLRAAIKDPVTGEIYVGLEGEEHSDIIKRLGLKGIIDEHTGFMKGDGTFITRKQGDELHGYETSGDMLKDQANIREELGKNVTFQDFEARELLRNRNDYVEHNQDNRGAIRVAYDPETGKKTFHILLDENKDQSTIFHESAHAFLYVMRDMLKGKDASPELKQMEKDTLKFLDANSWDDVFERKDGKITDSARDKHERFARGFEYRLWEGDVPAKGMKAVYDRFAKWIRMVYPTYETMQKYLGVEMTPDMRRVYDRIMSTQTDIDDAAQHNGYTPEAPKGLSPEEMHEWTKRHYDSLQSAYDVSYKSSFNAYKKENGLDAQQAKAKAEADNIKLHPDEIISKQMQRMTPDPKEQESKIYQDAKERAEKYVNSSPKWQVLDSLNPDYKDVAKKVLDNTSTPEERALFENIGIAISGEQDASVGASIALNADKNAEIQNRLDLEMKQYHAPGNANETKANLALMYGDARSNQLSAEYAKLLNISPEEVGSTVEQSEEARKANAVKEKDQAKAIQDKAKTEARSILNDTPSGESIRFDKYQTACKNAAEQYGKYAEKKDYANAAKWKYKELLNHELAKLAVRNQDVVPKLIRTASYLDEKTRMEEPGVLKVPVGIAKRINELLSKFNLADFRKTDMEAIAEHMDGQHESKILDATGMVKTGSGWKEETLSQLIGRMTEEDEHWEYAFPDGFNDLKKQDHTSLTLGELKAVVNAATGIYHFGKITNEIEAAGERRSFDSAVSSIKDKCSKVAEYKDREKTKNSISAMLEGTWIRSLGQLESVAERIEGKSGPLHDFITRKLRDSESNHQVMEESTYKELTDIRNKHFSDNSFGDRMKKKVSVDMGDGKFKQMSIMEIHNVMRNIGNVEGLQRIKDGNGFSDKAIENMKSHLTDHDMDYIKETCEVREKLWPLAKAVELKLHGVEPGSTEKVPVKFNGKTYEGWHHHLDYDQSLAPPTAKDSAVELENAYKNFNVSRATDDFSKSRIKNLNKPLTLDKDIFSQDLNQLMHYISYAEAVRDVNKLLKNKVVYSSLADVLTNNGAKLFTDQLSYLAKGGHGKQFGNTAINSIANALRWARISELSYNIGWRPKMYPIKLMTDINRSLWEDKNQFARSMWDNGVVIPSGDKFKAIEDRVNKIDPSMKLIGNTFNYNAQQFHEESLGKNSWQVFYNQTKYLSERLAHKLVSYTHFDTIYNNAKAEGKSDYEAAHLAREFVDNVFGTGSKTHHVMFSRGENAGEFEKGLAPAFQVFASWGNRFYIDAKKAQGNFKNKDYLTGCLATAKLFNSFVLTPAIINWGVNEVFRNPMIQNNEDKKRRLTEKIAIASFEMLPLARGVGDYGLNAMHSVRPWAYHLYPGEDVITRGVEVIKSTEKLMFDKEHFKQSDAEEMLSSALIASNNPKEIDTLVINGWKHMHQNIPYHWQDVTTPITKR